MNRGGRMKFKKGELTKESFKVIMHDLESLTIDTEFEEDERYHYNLLKANLKDIWGIK